MRILHVIQEFGSGGAEQVVRQLCTAGLTAGDEFAVACSGATVLLDGVPHLPLPMLHRRPSQVLAASWRLRDHVRDWNPDVVHAHNPGMAAITALATLRGAVRPGMVTIHGVRPADDIATSRLLRCTGLPVVACGAGVAATLRAHGTARPLLASTMCWRHWSRGVCTTSSWHPTPCRRRMNRCPMGDLPR